MLANEIGRWSGTANIYEPDADYCGLK